MPVPSPHSLAIVGAGPVGVEALLAALDAGLDAHVFERGEVGAHPIAWGHVRMFTPWSMNLGPSTRARLERAGWSAPDAREFPTGLELSKRYLEPAAAFPELKDRVHTHAQVVHISRRGLLKGDSPGPALRRQHPFRLLVRDAGGRENFLHAFAVLDASGVYGQPNWAGDGGIPARGEIYLAPQMSYHLDDVLGLRRERYAGKHTIVIGSGASAATVVADLATLSEQAAGTAVAWLTRKPKDALYADVVDDPLPGRGALHTRARELLSGAHAAVKHVGGVVVEGFEFNSATHRYRALLRAGEEMRTEEAEQVIVAAGYGPDNSIYRELQFHECYASRGPMKLAAALQGADAKDCLTVPAFGVEALESPEPDFFIVGHKSYGRTSHFLLETGYRQVADVIAKLAREQAVAAAS